MVSPLFSPPISKPIRGCLVAVIVLGTIIRLIGITTPLHGDELATVSLWAKMPLLAIPTHYEYPNNHIFHTLIVASILKVFGLHPFLLRTPVLFCGIASLALAFFTTHRITRNAQAGLAVSLLLAVSGGHIFYSTHARGYMLILLIGQYIFHRLIVWIDESERSPDSAKYFFSGQELFIFAALMMVGTWTLPTFALFEGSLGVFFLCALLFFHGSGRFDFSHPHMRNLAVIALCLLALFVQYYIFISLEMREMALSNAAQTELRSLPPAIFHEWIQPFESGGILFMFLALLGLYVLFQLNQTIFILIVCVLILPPVAVYTACWSGWMSVAPHARVFFYLQPFFMLCVVVGGFRLLYRLENKLGASAAGKIIPAVVLLLITAVSGKELIQVTWPERFARQPFDRVAEFVKQLGPDDLILLSTRPHVEFYLYGGKETQNRVDRILANGKLGDIYFVEYGEQGKSDTEIFSKEGVDYLRLNDYHQIVTTADGSSGILLPLALFESAQRIGNFTFRKVQPQFIQSSSVLRSPADWQRWRGTADSASVILEPPAMHPGNLPALKFAEAGVLIAESEGGENDSAFSININLMTADRKAGRGVSYLHAVEEDGQFVSRKAWIADEWVLDHPYGPDILNTSWQTRIFITEGKQPVEIIRIQEIEQGNPGRLRGIQSYRLVVPQQDLMPRGDKS